MSTRRQFKRLRRERQAYEARLRAGPGLNGIQERIARAFGALLESTNELVYTFVDEFANGGRLLSLVLRCLARQASNSARNRAQSLARRSSAPRARAHGALERSRVTVARRHHASAQAHRSIESRADQRYSFEHFSQRCFAEVARLQLRAQQADVDRCSI